MYNYPYAMSEEEILGNIKIPIGKAVAVDKPARLIIRLLFNKLNQSANSETAMLSRISTCFISSDITQSLLRGNILL